MEQQYAKKKGGGGVWEDLQTQRNNKTQAPALGNWTGLLLNGDTPANISVYSAQLLLNASEVSLLHLF